MIEGYKYERFDVIKQTDPVPYNYGEEYQSKLLGRGEGNIRMAFLRYGYMVGLLDRIPFRLLEVGYGTGEFLKLCATNGYTACYGNELSPTNIPDNCTFVSDITDRHYDVICFFDSLEHFSSLDFVKELKCQHIYLSIPNCHYESDEWFQNWYHRKPNEHIWHFSLQSLTQFMAYNGYSLMAHSFIEDVIRKSGQDIITLMFKKSWERYL